MGWWKKLYSKFADPVFAQKAHGILTTVWFLAALPICIYLSDSVPFLVFVSVYAVVTGHWAAWQACRTEVAQMMSEKKLKEDHERLKKIDPEHPQTEVPST